MKYKYSKILLVALFLINKCIHSQDPVFSQFKNNPIYLNPALVGEYKLRLSCVSNNQWFNIPGQLNTQYMSIDGSNKKDATLVWGCSFLRNSEGELSLITNNVSLIIGYRTKIKKHLIITFPLQLSIIGKSIDFSNAVFMQNLDPVFGNINSNNFIGPSQSYTYPTFSTGLNFSYLKNDHRVNYKIDFGGSVNNILSSEKEGFLLQNTVNNPKFTFYSTFFFNDKNFYRNSIFYQQQNIFKTLQISTDFIFPTLKNPTFGLIYRHMFMNSNLKKKPPFESLHFVVTFIKDDNTKNHINRLSISYGIKFSNLDQSDTFGIAEISYQFIMNKHNQWYSCPAPRWRSVSR